MIPGDGGRRAKVSAIGALTMSPIDHHLGFYFRTLADGYFGPEQVVAFLRQFLQRNRRLELVRLPAYSPDLNPVEAVWSWLKWGRLANFAPETVSELVDWTVEYLTDLKFDAGLLKALWERSDLPLPTKPTKPHT